MRWPPGGLIPFFSKDGTFNFNTFNARSEELRDKATYKGPFKSKRCVVPATGYNRRIKSAIAREERAATRAGQSVLRRERQVNEIKVKAGKARTRIKIVLGGDGLALEQGRISLEAFRQRAAKAGHELRMVNEAVAKIGLRVEEAQHNASGENSPAVAPTAQGAAPKPKKKIVRFWVAPPEEFRRRLRPELGLNYDPESIYWCGDVDPAKVELFIREHGHWDLVRFFNGAAGLP